MNASPLPLRRRAAAIFCCSRVSEDFRGLNMYRFAKVAVNVGGRAVRQVRHGSTAPQDFHTKYGTGVMIGGAVFCTTVWSYVLTQTGITWNLSPVGRVMPKPWREPEAEEE